jgi:hypothetical protein
LMRNITRIKHFMVKAFFSVAVFYTENSIEFAKIERPGLGDDGRLFPPYVNGVSQPFVVLHHDR